MDYSYNSKYLLGATIRRDGSSVFGPEQRYGLFLSFSLGWRVSSEGFMKNVSFINDLKLRGSYGILGSQANVDPSNAYSLYGSGFGTTAYGISGSPNSVQVGFAQATIGNPNTGWEEDIITNVGLDATILNKLSVNLEWYKKAINGLLFPMTLPATAGNATPPTVNIGDIQNETHIPGYSFEYMKGATFTKGKNEIYPIPQAQIDLSVKKGASTLIQNPGY